MKLSYAFCLVFVGIVFLGLPCSADASAVPSFDCSTRRDVPIEHILCSDSELASLDRTMADLYAKGSARTSDEERIKLRNAQREWLKRRETVCGLPARGVFLATSEMKTCLAEFYALRVYRLASIYGGDEAILKKIQLPTTAPFAVIIALGDYTRESGLSPLSGAINDAQLMSSTFSDLGYETLILSDMIEPAVRDWDAIQSRLADDDRLITASQLIIYFSGHGISGPSTSFLAMPNSNLHTYIDLSKKDYEAATAILTEIGRRCSELFEKWETIVFGNDPLAVATIPVEVAEELHECTRFRGNVETGYAPYPNELGLISAHDVVDFLYNYRPRLNEGHNFRGTVLIFDSCRDDPTLGQMSWGLELDYFMNRSRSMAAAESLSIVHSAEFGRRAAASTARNNASRFTNFLSQSLRDFRGDWTSAVTSAALHTLTDSRGLQGADFFSPELPWIGDIDSSTIGESNIAVEKNYPEISTFVGAGSSDIKNWGTGVSSSWYVIKAPDARYRPHGDSSMRSSEEYRGLSKLEEHGQILIDTKDGLAAFANRHSLEKYSIGAEIEFRMHRDATWPSVLEEINFLYRTLKSAGVRTDRISISGQISPFGQKDGAAYAKYRFRG